MLFNSTTFLVFFALFWPSYWLVQNKPQLRKWLILGSSYVFYGWWDWRFLSLIIISTLVDFWAGQRLARLTDSGKRRLTLAVSICVNIGMLGTFKYFDFFATSFTDVLSAMGMTATPLTLNIVLPVGISFYTFQTLTYTIDIYRRQLEPTSDLIAFAAFVAFFPQLVAGPIERARNLLPQIATSARFDFNQVRDGGMLILWGLFKKVLIADRIATHVDAVFADVGAFSPPQIAVAVAFFSVQIYCDFSGYSSIARGLAKTLGIELMVNFDRPYFARSLRDFWRRWHISLSTWFRDYVYIPLGGSHAGTRRTMINLTITFLVSGLWHGAAYTFVIWGALHAAGYFLDPFTRWDRAHDSVVSMTRKVLGFVWTAIFVNLAWIFFRADSLESAMQMLSILFSPVAWSEALGSIANPLSLAVGMSSTEFVLSFYLIAILIALDLLFRDRGIDRVTSGWGFQARWVLSWVFLSHLLLLAPSSTGSFIYFQF